MEDDGPQSTEPPSPGDFRGTLSVEIIDEHRALGVETCAWLESSAVAVLARVAAEGGGVRVRVVDDAEMASAHERWSGVSGTTDVLTFDLREGGGGPLDIDILVCVDEAQRQAGARGIAVGSEVLLYVVHGVLHCLGHDDHDEASSARMHAEEDRLLRAAGIGPVYSIPAQAGTRLPEFSPGSSLETGR